MNYKKRESNIPSFRRVKPAKAKKSGLFRGAIMTAGLLVVAGIAVFALDNDQNDYGVLGDAPSYSYINEYGIDYEYNNNYMDEYQQDDDYYSHQNYYDLDDYYQASGYYDSSYAQQYETGHDDYINHAPSYLGITPFSEVSVGTLAELRTAINDAPTNGALVTINITADFWLNGTGGINTAEPGTLRIEGGRNILLQTCRVTRPDGAPFQLRRINGNFLHFRVQGHMDGDNAVRSTLTIRDIVLYSGNTTVGGGNGEDENGGGIWVWNHGTLIMENGAVIRNNRSVNHADLTSYNGGGVIVEGTNATFIMNGGDIHNNIAGIVGVVGTGAGRRSGHGGGVAVIGTTSRFYFNGGVIGRYHTYPPTQITTTGDDLATWNAAVAPFLTGQNRARGAGGGVAVLHGATFIMNRPYGCVCHNIPEVLGCDCTEPPGNGLIVGNTSTGATNTEGGGPAGQTFPGRTAWSAAGVFVYGRNTLARMYGGAIRGNWAFQNAGGVVVREFFHDGVGQRENAAEFHLIGGYIGYNRSSRLAPGGDGGAGGGGGGGVSMGSNGTFVMYPGSYIRNNFAVSAGGGIRLRDGSRLIMYGGSIIENSGGARNSGTVANANTGGGGVYMCTYGAGDVAFYFYSGTIARNVSRCTRTEMQATTGARATTGRSGGGGIFIRGGDLHFRGSGNKYVEDNFSGGRGGGIFWAVDGYIHVDGRLTRNSAARPEYAHTGEINIRYNRSRLEGGGVYIRGTGFNATNFNITYNSAGVPSLPPGVTLTGAQTTADSNVNFGNGGGIDTNSDVILNNSIVSNNMAGGQRRLTDNNDVEIRPESLLAGEMGIGGGILISGGTFIANNNSAINNNSAGQQGGGINFSGSGTTTLTNSSVNNNMVRRTTGTGGGLNIAATGAISAIDSTINGNTSGSHGGGINAAGGGTVTLTNTSISNNTIVGIGDGGGIRNTGSLMTATDSNIDGNTGAQSGGGVFVGGSGTTAVNAPRFNMYGGTINNNSAMGHLISAASTQGGGGVFVEGVTGFNAAASGFAARFTMNDGEISYNTAVRGGGVFISGAHRTGGTGASWGGEFILNNGTISENRAVCRTYFHNTLTPDGGDGGGVFMDGSRRNATGSGIAHGSRFDMEGGYIEDNTAVRHGGGVFLDRGQAPTATSAGVGNARGSLFNMYTGYIRGNTAGYGTGTGDGGGVYLDGLTLYDNNTIHADAVARFSMTSGSIEDNTARDGGGVFVGGGRRVGTNTTAGNANIGRGGRFTIAGNSSVSGNTAIRSGGGIFLGGGHRSGSGSGGTAEGGQLNMSGTTSIHNNNASNGGGMFVGGVVDETTGASTRTAQSAVINMSGQATIVGNNAIAIPGQPLTGRGGGVHLAGNLLPASTGLNPASPRFDLNFGGPGTIANNTASRGGGIYVGGGHRTASAVSNAGVIHGAELLISNNAVVGPGNHAHNYGGGIYVSGGIRAGAGTGGSTGGILRIANGTVQGNTTSGRGGGIALRPGRETGTGVPVARSHPGALFSMRGGSIIGNTAHYDGGGIWIPNVCETYNVVPFFSDTLLLDLPAQANTIRNNRRLTDVNISGNTATTGYGGGIWLGRGLQNIYLLDSRVVSNTAGVNGGSVFLHASEVGGLGHGYNSLTMLGGYLSGSATRGGGVFIQGGTGAADGATFTMQSSIALAAVSGGTVFAPGRAIAAGLTPTIGNPTGSPFPRGQATLEGGGIFIEGGTSATNPGTLIMHTGSVGAADADGTQRGSISLQDGGGLFIGPSRGAGTYHGILNMPGTASRSFIGNHANNRGGGIFIPENIDLALPQNTNINHNSANFGGGVWITSTSELTMGTGANLNFNHANYDGGGAWLSLNSELSIAASGIVRGNSADRDGGGVFVSGGGTDGGAVFNMSGGIIGGPAPTDGNTAQRGGGVFVQGSPTAGNHGIFNLTTSTGDIRHNRATFGGGVYVSDGVSDATVVALSHDFSAYSTQYDAFYDDALNEAPEYLNEAPEYLNIVPTVDFTGSGGVFTMQGGHIRDNIAGTTLAVGNGGGVWVGNYAYFHANAISFNNNTAVGAIVENLPVGGMGGAIFTVRHEYRDPLLRVLPTWDGPANTLAYSNLIFTGQSNFSGNVSTLPDMPHMPPVNALAAIAAPLFGTTSQNPATPGIILHPLNNNDVNFMHMPDGMFHFFSTDERLYRAGDPYIHRLAGTQFILFRTVNMHVTDAQLNANPDGWNVRFNSSGESLSSLWVAVPFVGGGFTATSSNNPISFDFDGRFRYQLVQVSTLPGFQAPMGQWHITYNPDAPDSTNPFIVTTIGPSTPGGLASTSSWFPGGTTHPLPPEHNIWYFGSMIAIQLPMSGGYGSTTFIMLGSALLCGAMAVVAVVFVKKNRKLKTATVRYGTLLK